MEGKDIARTWDIRLDDYHISRDAYRELLYFCRQYDDKKRKAAEIRLLKVTAPDGMPRGRRTSDTTAQAAEKAARLSNDCSQIEQAAEEAAGDLAPYILLNATRGVSYYAMDIPASERTFNRLRRKFYFCLAVRRGMV